MTLHSEATKEIDLEALRAALKVLDDEIASLPELAALASSGEYTEVDPTEAIRRLETARVTVDAALAELTTRRARDAETHNAMAMALQHIRLCAPDPTVDAEKSVAREYIRNELRKDMAPFYRALGIKTSDSRAPRAQQRAASLAAPPAQGEGRPQLEHGLWGAVDRMLVDAYLFGGDDAELDMLSMRRRFDAAIAALAQQRVPDADEPDQALLISMATCLNHGFGMLGPQQQASMLHDMRKLWDEVQGRGYYTPANRGRYLAALNDNDPLADFNAAVNSQPVARNA